MPKRSRIELTPSTQTLSLLRSEIPVVSTINKKVVKKNDTTNVYARSNPRGKDIKDYQLTTRNLTDLLFPKWTWFAKSYGMNFAGGHYGDDTYGTTIASYPLASAGTATQQMAFALDDYVLKPEGWADTIAWEAGSQAWYESVFLPATWRIPTSYTLETGTIKNQMSMEGIIEQVHNTLPAIIAGASGNHAPENTGGDNTADYGIHYNGGSQTHYFINNEEFRVYFEAYEVIPREFMAWFTADTKGTNTRVISRNVHDTVSGDYVDSRMRQVNSQSAAGGIGTYNSALAGASNTNGQIICRKEDPGFRIAGWQNNVMQNFRVTRPIRGSIEPGGKFVYTMKCKPFKMLESTWRSIIRESVRTDKNPSDEVAIQHPASRHLVPLFSKILVVRFWSDMGNNIKTDAGYEVNATVPNPHQYNAVTLMPGRLMHYMTESHAARAIIDSPVVNKTFKDFTKLMYDEVLADQQKWVGINDEIDDRTQLN